MFILPSKGPRKDEFVTFFGKHKSLAVFSNLKVCRTLITLFYEYLTNIPEAQREANELTGRLRGHTMEKVKTLTISQTTTIYTQEADESKENHFSKQMFERGFYGWSYFMTLKIALEDKDFQSLSSQDVTDLIVAMQDKQSPLQLEGFGKFLLTQEDQKRTFIEEIRQMPKTELWSRIQKVCEGIMPAKIPESQCFRYGDCPYPKPDVKCRQCVYQMPNKYFLISLNKAINGVIEDIRGLFELEKVRPINLETDILKKWSILFEYVSLLGEALNDDYGLSRETVAAFINVDEVYEKLKVIDEAKKTRFLIREV